LKRRPYHRYNGIKQTSFAIDSIEYRKNLVGRGKKVRGREKGKATHKNGLKHKIHR